MSLLNSPDGVAHGSTNGGGGVGAANGGTTQFEMQVALIPDEYKFEYRSARKLARRVEKTFDSRSADQYFLYFHGVVDRELDEIEEELESVGLRRRVRLTFENAFDAAIIRITDGPKYTGVGESLYLEIIEKTASIPGHSMESIEPFGATLLELPGVFNKEGDEGFGPESRLGRDAWPSVMMEIGYSGGEDFLRLDALWWLMNTAGRIRFVILVFVTKNPLALGIECWSMAEFGDPEPRQTSVCVPTCVANFNIDPFGNVKSPMGSTELRIPYGCIFDQHQDGAEDVVFSIDELTEFALRRYRMLK